jgi:uncharacterized protein (DUF697 family)
MEYARDKARKYINNYTAVGAGYSILPIPIGTTLGLTAAEAAMVGQIAKIYGLRMDTIVGPLILKVILLKVGGAAALKALAEGLNFIPIIGWIAKPFVAGATIKAVGEGALIFFESRFPDQRANSKPAWEVFISVFGVDDIDVDIDELREYWESL